MKINSLCVFCGSSFGTGEDYRLKTAELGKILAEKNIELVYGGGGVGLMGVIAESVLNAGGRVTGVIPKLIHSKVKELPLSEIIITDDMHSRKRIMYDRSDAFTALPGGIGTIEELSEVLTWQQLGYHSKPVSLFNIKDFFKGFSDFLIHAQNQGFIKKVHRKRLIIENDPHRLLSAIEDYSGEIIDKWS